MKVGIITFHYGYNYGAALQCVGLYKTLKQLGHDVDVIDYRPSDHPALHLWQGWGIRRKHPWHNIKKRWIGLRYGGSMRKRFNTFLAENVTFSAECDDSNVAEVIGAYDALIVGSDQVWNRSYRSVTPVYFLHFSEIYSGVRVSYAACCGHSKGLLEGLDDVRQALLQFDSISVRNQTTFKWVNELTGLSPEIVCDPSLLFEYENLAVPAALPYEKYILAYVLGEEIRGGHKLAFAEIKKGYGKLPVVWICSSAHKPEQVCKWADHIAYTAGPAEWLALVENAAFIYTDSFHGTVFAMKYRKPFLAYYAEESRADRLLDIAKRYGVGHSVTGTLQDALKRKCLENPLDYESVTEQIHHHRQISRSFLKESLCCE